MHSTALEEAQHFGTWRQDDAGLPCFDLTRFDGDALNAAFKHLISTGHISAIADRSGNVNLFTTEGGFLWLNSPDSSFARGSLYAMLEIAGETTSLLFSELSEPSLVRIGTGYIEYHGVHEFKGRKLRICQQVHTHPDRSRTIQGQFTLENIGSGPVEAGFELRSDVAPSTADGATHKPTEDRAHREMPGAASFPNVHEQLGSVTLRATEDFAPYARRTTLRLSRQILLNPGDTLSIPCAIGYGDSEAVALGTPDDARRQWATRLAPYRVSAPEQWMEEEIVWNAGQLLSFTAFDSSTNEYYTALGGYGWPSFGVREVAETSMAVADCDQELAESSIRFVAKTQLESGDVPKIHNLRRDRQSHEFESDNELWFVLGTLETIRSTGNTGMLDQVLPYWDKGSGSLWEHLERAFHWVRDSLGRGPHGLVLIRDGDWNDYLSMMGAEGRGESVMNSGMACRAFSMMAEVARERGAAIAIELEEYVAAMRAAVASAFDGCWFVRGYTDAGKAVGATADDRLFINAQAWPVLGRCGTPEQRVQALRNAIARCHTSIGLTLMSRPYSSPAPDDISWCAIPQGEGENAGIWPQTVGWFIWALAEEGLLEEALEEWKCGTLRAHARNFPTVPFGIFNGPDCFSSHWAGAREGWTQYQLLDRARFVPMNPMVAWQGFSMRKINAAQTAHSQS